MPKFEIGDTVVIERHDEFPKIVDREPEVTDVHKPIDKKNNRYSYELKLPWADNLAVHYVPEDWLREM